MFTISRSAFQPKSSIVEVTSSSRSVVVKYATFSSRTPAPANCFARSSVPDPGGPVTSTVDPFGTPFIRALSRAAIPVDTTFATSPLPLNLEGLVDREAVDGVEDHEVLPVRGLPDQVLDLEHEVLEHRGALDVHRVALLLARGHHDLGDAVDEPDVLERDLQDVERVDDRRGGDRGRDVDR